MEERQQLLVMRIIGKSEIELWYSLNIYNHFLWHHLITFIGVCGIVYLQSHKIINIS